MTTLKEARKQNKLSEFIKEHKRDAKGDANALEATLRSMAGKSKEAPAASSRDGSDD